MATVLMTLVGLLLAASAALKLRSFPESAAALSTYGIPSAAQDAVLVGVCAIEIAAAAAAIAFGSAAAGPIAALFLIFAAAAAAALAFGHGGRPCACFGAAGRLTTATAIRALALAALTGVLASGAIPSAAAGATRWLTVGVTASLATAALATAAALALAREVAVLRLRMPASGALEIESEGPVLGEVQPWAGAIGADGDEQLLLAVFSSEGCALCQRVRPAVVHVGADPLVAAREFDELADAAVWSSASIPGSPYAVALDLDGRALAKGTFNGLSQLESVLATARARAGRETAAAGA